MTETLTHFPDELAAQIKNNPEFGLRMLSGLAEGTTVLGEAALDELVRYLTALGLLEGEAA